MVWPVSGPGPGCVAGQIWLDPRTGDQHEAGVTRSHFNAIPAVPNRHAGDVLPWSSLGPDTVPSLNRKRSRPKSRRRCSRCTSGCRGQDAGIFPMQFTEVPTGCWGIMLSSLHVFLSLLPVSSNSLSLLGACAETVKITLAQRHQSFLGNSQHAAGLADVCTVSEL